MANMEKLVKAFEALKAFQQGSGSPDESGQPTGTGVAPGGVPLKKKEVSITKKDRVSHLTTIADAMCSATFRPVADFPKFLGISMETFLVACDDPEPDVRMNADECLNRTIKSLLETNLGRLQVELYKEIKKNGPSRSLRAALWRFADLAHFIRPQKCRPYVVNLVPCVQRIARRPEEAVQESLGTFMNKILPVLGSFTNDTEVKLLLKTFLPSLKSASAATRRTAASSLSAICQHSRKPTMFFAWLVNVLLGMVVPVHEERKSHVLLGVLLCFRHVIPHLANPNHKDHSLKGSFGITRKEQETGVSIEQLIQIYELLLYYSQNIDHNVVTASLETLQQLLRTPPPPLLSVLLSPNGIKRKTIFVESGHDPLIRQNTSEENLDGHANRLPSEVGDEDSGLEELQDDATQQLDKSPSDQSESMAAEAAREELLAESETPDKETRYSDAFPDDGEVIVQTDEDTGSYSNVAIGENEEDASPGADDEVFETSESSGEETKTDQKLPSLMGESVSQQGSSTDIRVSVSPSLERARTPDSSASATPKEAGSMEQLDIFTHSRDNSSGSSSTTLSSTARIREGDIGNYTDNNVPLIHCVRLMCASYLLTGYSKGLTPDRFVRVSVKGLAIACVGNAISLYPKVFFAKLFKTEDAAEKKEDEQLIRDVVLYINHHDPQLRGNSAVLIGQLIRAMIVESNFKPESGIQSACELFQTEQSSVESLVSLLVAALGDDSSSASRNLCSAIKLCLSHLCNTVHGELGLKLILALLPLSNNNYWLVKVKLLDVLSSIDFILVYFLENTFTDVQKGDHHFFGFLHLQDRILQQVIIKLLGDEDSRVRDAASKAIVELVPKLFYAMDHPQHDPVITKAKNYTCDQLEPVLQDQAPYTNTHTTAMKEMSVFQDHSFTPAFTEESALSRVVDKLVKAMNSCTSRHLMSGCCHALCELSIRFPVIQFASAWSCASITTFSPKDGSKANRVHRQTPRTFSSGSIASITSGGSTTSTVSLEELNTGSGGGVLPLILSLLTSSSLPLDLSTHQDALLLAGNLMAGAAFKSLRTNNDKANQAESSEEVSNWSAFQDKSLVPLADQLLQHLARLLNVCAHVIEGTQPGPPKIQPSLPSLPTGTSLSPIKKKTKGKEKEVPEQTSAPTLSPAKTLPSKDSAKLGEKHDGAEKDSKDIKSSKTQLGAFFHLPQYMRLYEVLKGAHSNYKITLDLSSPEKFGGLLKTALESLAQLLEFANFSEIGKYSEELLGFLKSTVQREPTATILTVQQLLKALFSTNLGSQWESSSSHSVSRKPGKATRLTSNMKPGLYHSCFTTPYTQFTQSLAASSFKPSVQTETEQESSSWFSWMRKKSGDRRSSSTKPTGKDKSHIHNYIRLFEPLVIKALKQYTITSSLTLQQQVLHLLAQLVQLRVNYCLLDSDQIFIGFVIKQFEFIEEGQIKESENLIPHIFHFLVLLSYERYHTKAIIGMPKIIQLCDGIMASGQQATTHAIPALRPIVHDLFVLRGSNKSDSVKELDTQREVVISMLIRLIQYHEVLDMFIVVLQQHHRESEEKWKRLSRQVIDMVLPLLAKHQVNLDNQQGLDTLHRLFEGVASSALRPVDMLLKTMFMQPHDVSTLSNLQRWLSLVLAILRVVISQSKEEVILTRLQELGLQVNIFTHTHTQAARNDGKRSRQGSTSGSPEEMVAPETPEEIFARFLLQVVGLMVTELSKQCSSPAPMEQPSDFLVKQLSHLLLYISHMFKSGSFRRVAGITMSMILSQPPDIYYSVTQLNTAFQSLIPVHPTLTLQWCQLQLILSYTDETWWGMILQTPQHQSLTAKLNSRELLTEENELANQKYCCGEIIKKGGLILFCDYVCENLTDAEPMTWLIVNHVNEIVNLSYEPPVQDFISAIHRNPAASGLFIQALHLRCESFSTDPCTVKRTLQCLEPIHLSQSGALLTLLIDKYLKTKYHALCRQCDSIACRRVEMLLAESVEECKSQMPLEDLQKLLDHMHEGEFTKRYARLVSLLTRLKYFVGGEDAVVTPSPSDTGGFVAKADVNKEWYMSVVRECCFSQTSSARECSLMLHKLEYSDILTIMMTEEFDLSILEDCIALGVKKTRAAKKALSQAALLIKRDSATALAKKQEKQATRADPLLQAAQLTLLRHISNIVNMLPTPHQVLSDVMDGETHMKYRLKLENFFKEPSWCHMVFDLSSALVRYLVSLPGLPMQCFIPSDSQQSVGRFAVLCVEIISWYVLQDILPPTDQLQRALECLSKTLQNTTISNIIGTKENVTLVCSAIGCVYHIITGEFLKVIKACDLISEMVSCLQTHLSQGHLQNVSIPPFLAPTLRNLVIGLARLPLVNSYARTPHIVWKMGWMPTPSGELKSKLPPLPIEYLQDKEVLKEFVYRVNVLGWTSRQQFEETWAALLGVLSAPPLMDEMSNEEDIERTQSSCLAVRAITALLIRTLLKPEAGNPTNSGYRVVTRHKELPFLNTQMGRKLCALREEIELDIMASVALRGDHASQHEYQYRDEPLLCQNQERELGDFHYRLGQISIPSLGTQLNLPSPVAEMPQELEEGVFANISNAPGKLDIHSCLMFLLELYGQWMNLYATPKTPLMLLCETAKSVLFISDVFTEHAQYEWMFDTLLEVQKNHPVEDELLTQYIIPGICKAAAVLGMDSAICEKVSKLLEVTLRSVHLPCRIAALQGILYLLESKTIEDVGAIIPVVTEYLVRNLAPLSQISCIVSQKHVLCMLATSFYLIEHYVEHIKDMEFSYNIIQICITMVSSNEEAVSPTVYHTVMRGMERLLLAGVLTTSESDALVKCSVDRLCMASTHRSMSALGLMLTCMYTGRERERQRIESGDQSVQETTSHDPERLLIAMERVTALFDRIRKGFPSEARVIARILPTFLIDFFPAQDIMNKVIGEFLSSQQPHPQLMARVVFKVFSKLHQQGQTVLVRDWVMLSLSNFTQRTPVSMAIWSLTCFFISSSTNMWICALLPHVIGRMGKLETIDKRNFCVAALDFYNHQLVEEGGKRAFISIFQSVSTNDGPYAELLAACNGN
ncbi:huntingtin-like isoform X2 [Ptychodera flava]|uniref:huntingtin-like isoform X2 n=1 Tax=Ptychodera flava TaxID=63121 RepID=UPI00396AA329